MTSIPPSRLCLGLISRSASGRCNVVVARTFCSVVAALARTMPIIGSTWLPCESWDPRDCAREWNKAWSWARRSLSRTASNEGMIAPDACPHDRVGF
ncbi:hypothetical protein BDV93DRAFT_181636 [Ceratobasidium sp. AG-I]|nr:hypothetical protein BDV93DRAFT_181636 [Ceratobasidium sp. AG-I]